MALPKRLGQWWLRWGVIHFRASVWKWPGHWLTRHGWPVGVRTAQQGWLVMPLHRLAEWAHSRAGGK